MIDTLDSMDRPEVVVYVGMSVDGFVARRWEQTGQLGKILDPLADKLLLVSCYVVLGVQQRLPAWLVALVILRDVVIVVGALVYHFHVEHVDARPTLISKLNTAAQILRSLPGQRT